jgi:antitoxin VapB
MALNIKNDRVKLLVDELSKVTGESKTAVILRALEERKARIALHAHRRRAERVIDFLEREIWPNIPDELLGRRISKRQREQILGYGKNGV